MKPRIVRTVADLRQAVAVWRAAGERVGLVPTMGALHDGHLSLVRAAFAQCRRTIVSIFVNPTQFGPNADFDRYPRDLDGDVAKLAPLGVDVVFNPDVAEMYPSGFATTVTVAGLTDGLCGPFRPGHFAGVATVVSKLLNQAGADAAFFGEKDWQQLQVIRRLARDLDIPVAIVGVPTVREADGLAMSSRNLYLSPDGARAGNDAPSRADGRRERSARRRRRLRRHRARHGRAAEGRLRPDRLSRGGRRRTPDAAGASRHEHPHRSRGLAGQDRLIDNVAV